jgi:hypothetical protein
VTGWIVLAGLLAAQAAQGPGVAPDPPAPRDQAIVDAQVRAAIAVDILPRRDVVELRPLIGLELTATPARWATARFDGTVEALAADRGRRAAALRAEIRDLWFEARGSRADIRAGYGRLVWGRLDEIAPTDVINPLDAARFLLEGRSEARLPVAFVRARWSASDRLTAEGVLVPVFRRGLFDRLDERTSPFNLINEIGQVTGVAVDWSSRTQREPEAAWRNVAGGARLQATAGRVDVAASVFRGFDGTGPVGIDLVPTGDAGLPAPMAVEYHPRFTMVGADAETVVGEWAVRAEAATFVERSFTGRSRPGLVDGRSFDGGVGVDRRAGSFRVFSSVVVHREWSDEDPLVSRTDVNIVGSIERSLDRERYLARAFVVVNPVDAAVFLRAVLLWNVRDRLTMEGSAGTFLGSSDDTIGRFKTRDFMVVRMRTWF